MNEFVTELPMLNETFVRLTDDPVLMSFLVVILLVFLLFVSKTRQSYKSLGRRLKNLRAELASIFGSDDVTDIRHFDKFDARHVRHSGILADAFDKHGFGGAGRAIVRNSRYYTDTGRIFVSNDTLTQNFSANALEKNQLPPGAASRSAVLTTLGALGTFVGLVMGVHSASSGLASPDPSQAVASISDLLAGAELAFLTSIFGLTLALAHGAILNRQRKKLSRVAGETMEYLAVSLRAMDQASFIAFSENSTRLELENLNENTQKHHKEAIGFNGAFQEQIVKTCMQIATALEKVDKSSEETAQRLASLAGEPVRPVDYNQQLNGVLRSLEKIQDNGDKTNQLLNNVRANTETSAAQSEHV